MHPTGQFDTSLSLLDQLADGADGASWDRLVNLYSPLLRSWLARYDVQDADADDLTQDVLMVVMREAPGFRHNRQAGAFRTWLRRILVNRLRNFWRSRGRMIAGNSQLARRLKEFEDPRSPLSQTWDREHNRRLTRQLLAMIEPRFSGTTQAVFRRLVLDGARADEVAAEFDLSMTAVFTAKSRVLRELRRLGKGMID
ncbi:MAG: RNA polymerase sigma factor [Planctomycetes bacterium]|nr:RNA polymerase sigma factor [Planctomycetota bacterium]